MATSDTTSITRVSAITPRHHELGAQLEAWNGMQIPQLYRSDANVEHAAVRQAAGLFDRTALHKLRVTGPDASAVVNHAFSREAGDIYPGRSSRGLALYEDGRIGDDAIVYNLGDAGWLWCHGGGDSLNLLGESAAGKDVTIGQEDDLHLLSLQGPAAFHLLNSNCPDNLNYLQYFHHLGTELFGCKVQLSRTGYSGERGYEIFVSAAQALALWDQLVEHGASMGVMPCSYETLNILRIEAGLPWYGRDLTADLTPWEAGLGHTLSGELDYRGKQSAESREGHENQMIVGLVIDYPGALSGGEAIGIDGSEIGVVTSACWSQLTQQSLALARVSAGHSLPGTELAIALGGQEIDALVTALPFFDPAKTRTRA